jgi:hypothetical protein
MHVGGARFEFQAEVVREYEESTTPERGRSRVLRRFEYPRCGE